MASYERASLSRTNTSIRVNTILQCAFTKQQTHAFTREHAHIYIYNIYIYRLRAHSFHVELMSGYTVVRSGLINFARPRLTNFTCFLLIWAPIMRRIWINERDRRAIHAVTISGICLSRVFPERGKSGILRFLRKCKATRAVWILFLILYRARPIYFNNSKAIMRDIFTSFNINEIWITIRLAFERYELFVFFFFSSWLLVCKFFYYATDQICIYARILKTKYNIKYNII